MTSHDHDARRRVAFILIVAGTLLGIAGTDLVLPAIPFLPEALGTTHASAQYVLAAFVVGAAAGLLAFGALGARLGQRGLLIVSLLAYSGISAIAAASTSVEFLIVLRFLQGLAGSAAAVFAPGMIRALYGDQHAVSALGLLNSVEMLAPAFAPVVGAWLLHMGGWPSSFVVIAAAAMAAAISVALLGKALPEPARPTRPGGYLRLLRDGTFMRYACSHALVLGALLVIVFAAPTVFVVSLGATLADFILMQIVGIAAFVVAANLSGRLVAKYGREAAIWTGTWVAAASAVTILILALSGAAGPLAVTLLFIPFNIGLGLRGPAGFHGAVVAASGDDARGAAIVVVAILVVAAAGTAGVAPFITFGLLPMALVSTVLVGSALAMLALLPTL
ncbi:MFS transporter [Mesorhizobium sp. 1B3]|uniref:MFS transporter n=1 Tax=Mesorhizobium sp. 1B3 TaxID=3243599 RepID=UPI003D993C9E